MQLEDIESKEQLLAALKEGDPELESEIESEVLLEHGRLGWESAESETEMGMEPEEFVWMVKNWAAPEGETEGPLSEILDHFWHHQPGAASFDVPAEKVNEALEEKVLEAAERMSDLLAGKKTSWPAGSALFSFETGRGGGIDLRDVQTEWRLHLHEPLAWVPSEKVVKILNDERAYLGAHWELIEQYEDESSYSTGWCDSGDPWRLTVDRGELAEWAADLRKEYFSELVDADPEEAIKAFVAVLKSAYPALYKRVKKAKFPKDVLADYAVAFFEDQEQGIEILNEATGSFGYEGTRGEVILEVDKAALRALGITSGRWWDGAPWKLLNLPVEELAYEGTLMRHCVGRFDMGYRNAVERGVTQIWSLRSQFNRPILTFEIDTHEWKSPHPTIRAGAIQQLKGKLNRPGGEDQDEAQVLYWIFSKLGVDPAGVEDFAGEAFIGPAENPGFNRPWAPYHQRRMARLLRW